MTATLATSPIRALTGYMTLPSWLSGLTASGSGSSRVDAFGSDSFGFARAHLISAAAALNPDASTVWSVPSALAPGTVSATSADVAGRRR